MLRNCIFALSALFLNDLTVINAKYRYVHMSGLDGYVSNTQTLYTGTVRSELDCAVMCEMHKSDCVSFFYTRLSGSCKVHNFHFASTTGLIHEQSTKYYKRETVCTDGWIPFQGHCYWIVDHALSYSDSVGLCVQNSSNLVHIEGLDENTFIRNYVSELPTPRSHWIGLSDLAVEGVWRWSNTGATLTYHDWSPGQPNGGIGSSCAALYSSYSYHWVDEPCHYKYYPICKRT